MADATSNQYQQWAGLGKALANTTSQVTTTTSSGLGGLIGGQPGISNTARIYPNLPTWEQFAGLQGLILQLQQEIIRLHKELAKIKEVKDWLVGEPETTGVKP